MKIKRVPELVEWVAHKMTDEPMTNVNNSPLKQIIEFQIQRDTDELLSDGFNIKQFIYNSFYI